MNSNLIKILDKEKNNLPKEVYQNIQDFFISYENISFQIDLNLADLEEKLNTYLQLIKKELKNPTKFDLFHKRQTEPIDFYTFATSLLSPFVDKKNSKIYGINNIKKIIELVKKGENVILLANHQAEADPTILGILLDKLFPEFIKNIICIAGAKVTSDPVTVPLTLGQNVLCVYSKKYFNFKNANKTKMQQHNSASMLTLRHLLNEGGKCVYVAPSGGRDRIDANGLLSPAVFDDQSIELMRIVGSKAKNPTHYFPLAVHTYNLLPPPQKQEISIGEKRQMEYSPVYISFGTEIRMNAPLKQKNIDKKQFRKNQADFIHSQVKDLYQKML